MLIKHYQPQTVLLLDEPKIRLIIMLPVISFLMFAMFSIRRVAKKKVLKNVKFGP